MVGSTRHAIDRLHQAWACAQPVDRLASTAPDDARAACAAFVLLRAAEHVGRTRGVNIPPTPWQALLPGDASGWSPPPDVLRSLDDTLAPWDDASPDSLGPAWEDALASHAAPADSSARHARGAYYTPPSLIEHLLDHALEPALQAARAAPDPERALRALRVVDPSCGAGRFLVAAARRIGDALAHVRARTDAEGRTAALRDALACVHGVDVDPVAVALARAVLRLEAGPPDLADGLLARTVVHGDALTGAPPDAGATHEACARWGASRGLTDTCTGVHWHLAFPEAHARGGFDVVVGNPPFLNQHQRATAVGRDRALRIDARLPGMRGRSTDTSALFLALGLDLLRPGGRMALVHPLSFLSVTGAAAVRRALTLRADVVHAWFGLEPVFPGATVRVAATVVERPLDAAPRDGRATLTRTAHLPPRPLGACPAPVGDAWSGLLADLLGAPPALLTRTSGVLGDRAAVTADFRQHFFGLRGHVREEPETAGAQEAPAARLIVTRHVDPAANRWGAAPCTFDGQRYTRPVVHVAGLGTLEAWARRRLVPKLVVGTQGRVLEAFADEDGDCLNTTPTITVLPRAREDLWHLLAVLLAPAVTALAFARHAGGGLSTQAIRLSAAQVSALPLPGDAAAWDEGAAHVRDAMRAANDAARWEALIAGGHAMGRAYGVVDPETVHAWWAARLAARVCARQA